MSLGNTENSEHNISFITLLQFLPGEVLEVLLFVSLGMIEEL